MHPLVCTHPLLLSLLVNESFYLPRRLLTTQVEQLRARTTADGKQNLTVYCYVTDTVKHEIFVCILQFSQIY